MLGPGKNPRSVGIPIFSDPADLPVGEQVVSFLLRLRYLDPIETAGVLQQYIPPGNTVNFTALEKAGAVIVTDDATTVRRLVDLVASLDQPLAPVTEKWIRLERADASKAVEFLNSVFDSKSASSGSTTPGQAGGNVAASTTINGGRRPIRRGGEEVQGTLDNPVLAVSNNGTGPITLSGDSIIQGRITLTPDVRTNRVHVVTSPVNMPIVEHLLEEYDSDTPFAQPVPRPLKFVNANDVLPILVQALAEPGTENNGTGTTGSTSGTSNSSTSNNNRNSSTSSSNGFNSNSSSSSFGSSTGGSSGSGAQSIGDSELNTQAVDTKPTIATVGSTKLIADSRVNTILVLGSAEARDKVDAILDRLDVRAPQVVIRTVIGELSLSKNSELGFNYLLRTNRGSILNQFSSSQLPGSTTTTNAAGSPSTTTTSTLDSFSTLANSLAGISSNFSGVGGIISIGKSFDVILSALEGTNRFKTISRPMIFTSNNKEAIIASGEEIAVPTETVSSLNTVGTVGNTGLTSNVEYKDVVLQLEVVPLINSQNEVTLDIVQRIDNVVTTPGSGTVVAGNSVPTIATRKLKSTVSAPNNSTIVLGGLITQDSTRTDNNIPYLSRIPVLGALFRSRVRDADRSELIILMHPEVVNTPTGLERLEANEGARTYLGGNLEPQLLPAEVRKATAVRTTTTTTLPPDPKGRPGKKEVVKKTTTRTKVTTKTEPNLDNF